MQQQYLKYLLIVFIFINCSSSEDNSTNTTILPSEESMYFPPINSTNWEEKSMEDLGWNSQNYTQLKDFLETSNTEAFMILHNGKIVVEEYLNGFTATQRHTWNSAAKTLTASMVGIAQNDNFLNIEDSSQQYLGTNWSSLTDAQEKEITIKNHLTMTTGLDYEVARPFCTEPNDLVYKDTPNSFWYYHNAPYTLLQSIVANATQQNFDTYFNTKLQNQIGMTGVWVNFGCNRLYLSDARSMARFGLLCLNVGKWNTNEIIPNTYFNNMTSTSQNLNAGYGYLWWLNGKENYKIPQSSATFQGKLIPNAPNDLIAGLGKNDQKLYVVPSKKLVIIRFGDASSSSILGPSGYDNELWEKINDVIN